MSKKFQGRMNALILRHLSQILLEETNDPRLTRITLTGVEINRDTTRAEVYYSLMGTPEEIVETQRALDRAAGWLRNSLVPVLRLRNIPQLVFRYDPSLAQGAHIEELLQRLRATLPAEASEEAPEPAEEDADWPAVDDEDLFTEADDELDEFADERDDAAASK